MSKEHKLAKWQPVGKSQGKAAHSQLQDYR